MPSSPLLELNAFRASRISCLGWWWVVGCGHVTHKMEDEWT